MNDDINDLVPVMGIDKFDDGSTDDTQKLQEMLKVSSKFCWCGESLTKENYADRSYDFVCSIHHRVTSPEALWREVVTSNKFAKKNIEKRFEAEATIRKLIETLEETQKSLWGMMVFYGMDRDRENGACEVTWRSAENGIDISKEILAKVKEKNNE